LARAGVASRRAAESLIVNGHVRVNGRIVKELGSKADPFRDKIELNGRLLALEKPVYYLLNKPRAVVTTLRDPEKRRTIADLMKKVRERVFPVGRLDYHTSGALFVTNDGAMAQALLHPRNQVPKTYVAKFRGLLDNVDLERLRSGVDLGNEMSGKARVVLLRVNGGNTWAELTISEGKNREILRMGTAIGHPVLRLSRISFAGLTTEGLRPGQYRLLREREVGLLKRRYYKK
jgi:23S rRNA pseudouridine2605 synthase